MNTSFDNNYTFVKKITPDLFLGEICIGLLSKSGECKHWVVCNGKIDQWDREKILLYLRDIQINQIPSHFHKKEKSMCVIS